MKEMTRRDFFKLSGAAVLMAASGSILTGCSGGSSTPVMFGDRIDMGDMYAEFAAASVYPGDDDDSFVGEYTVYLYPKEGKNPSIEVKDFGMKMEGLEAKNYKIYKVTGRNHTKREITRAYTVEDTTEICCVGVLVKDAQHPSAEEQAWAKKLYDYADGKRSRLEAEANLTHKEKKYKAITHEVDLVLGS